MAIYHLSGQVISRSSGRSSVAAAAYRAGLKLVDERTGEVHDYSRKRGIEHREVLAPANAPAWASDRARLWNEVERVEKRKDAQLAREFDIALPVELDAAQRLALVREFVREQFVERGMVADLDLHRPGRDGDDRNHHAHVMLTMRSIDADGFGGKVREWNDKDLLKQWRESWERHANAALQRAGLVERIDHRTLVEQGIERAPQIHLGPHVVEMEARGVQTERGGAALAIADANDELQELSHARRIVEGEIRTHSGADRRGPGQGHRAVGAEHDSAGRRPAQPGGGVGVGEQRPGRSMVEGPGVGLGLGGGFGGGDAGAGQASGARAQRGDAAGPQRGQDGRGSGEGRVVAPGQALAAGGLRGRGDGGAYERVLDLAAPFAPGAGGEPGRGPGRAVPDDQRRTDMPTDRTAQAVERQLAAMDCKLYEVGILGAKGMLIREWAADMIRKSIAWLKRENAKGQDIYIRPARKSASSLVLVDDLSADTVRGLAGRGLAPALVTETSKGNYQAWVRLTPESQPPAFRTQAAKALARELGGDPNSADHAHFGRLAGFTNRKPERAVDGRQPFVLVERADPAAVAQRGGELVREAKEALAQARAVEVRAEVKAAAAKAPAPARAWAQRSRDLGNWYTGLWKGLESRFGKDFDASRADWMAAVALIGKGYDVDSVADAIAKHSPNVEQRKGRDLDDYIVSTAGKAEIWCELRDKGAAYADVAEKLLPLAQQRQAERSAEHERQASARERDRGFDMER